MKREFWVVFICSLLVGLLVFVTPLFIGIALSVILNPADASDLKKLSERDYQNVWCSERGGRVEVRLDDGTRADCLTEEFAVEFDFARKWAEAPFQALHYARLTGKKPAIVLICRKMRDGLKLQRIIDNLKHYGIKIDIWSIGCGK